MKHLFPRGAVSGLLSATLLTVALIFCFNDTQAALSIDYTMPNQASSASIYYYPSGDGTFRGTNLSVTGVTGNGTPLNAGGFLPMTSGTLTFQTGALSGVVNNTYYFDTPGTLTITGGIPAYGLPVTTSLVSGHFNSAQVTYFPLAGDYEFNILGASISDVDNANIYSYFGLQNYKDGYNALTLAFIASTNGTGGFTSTNITGGALADTPVTATPIPATAPLLGSGVMGFAAL